MHKIYIIDDDKTMVALLSKLLQFEGFEVVPFDGKEDLDAITELVRSENPAVVLIDVNLKEISGFDILHRLKNESGLTKPLLLMSSGMDFSAQCEAEGADGFIQKPYMPEELVERINQILSGST